MGAFGLVDEAGHSMTTTPAQGKYNHFLCSCGRAIYLSNFKKDGTANSYARRYWRDHLESVTTPDDFFVTLGHVQKQRVKWTVNVFTNRHPDFAKYNIDKDRWYSGWYKNQIAQDPNWVCFVVGLQKSGKSRWTVHRVMEGRQGAIDVGMDVLRKAKNNPQNEVEYEISGDPGKDNILQAVVEIVSVDIVLATSQILNEADEAILAGDLNTMMEKKRDLQDLLSMEPLLKMKVQEIDASLANRLGAQVA